MTSTGAAATGAIHDPFACQKLLEMAVGFADTLKRLILLIQKIRYRHIYCPSPLITNHIIAPVDPGPAGASIAKGGNHCACQQDGRIASALMIRGQCFRSPAVVIPGRSRISWDFSYRLTF
jgi:hypothetical protein